MRWILFTFSALAFIDGFLSYTTAETIFQQIVGIIGFVLFGIFFSSAAIVDAIVNLKKEFKKNLSSPNEHILGSGKM